MPILSVINHHYILSRCLFSDKQLIRLQETPDEIPEGETPHTVSLFAFDDLVDSVRPGDRIEVSVEDSRWGQGLANLSLSLFR